MGGRQEECLQLLDVRGQKGEENQGNFLTDGAISHDLDYRERNQFGIRINQKFSPISGKLGMAMKSQGISIMWTVGYMNLYLRVRSELEI